MAPTPEETLESVGPIRKPDQPLSGNEVVISGMSGIYPSSDSTLEFMENLYNKVDMITPENHRWEFNHPEVPKQLGIVNGMEKFDAQFFRVHYKQACTMEPMSRKLLEHAYSAIYDSGLNPIQLRGKKIGVFIGSTFSESEKIAIYKNVQRNGFGITGCNRAMYANRISYWLDSKGPSYTLDLACASSMTCLEHAYKSISSGQCEAAIVGGCNLCMHPNVSLHLRRAGYLCLDGKTKCFDKKGDGYVRGDAINVLFLQRAKDAKRLYAEVYFALTRYTLEPCPDWQAIRKSENIQQFLEEFYSKIDVSPSDVEYVEANAAAIAEADANELDAIAKIFAKDKIIKVGSVKSNMGHSEPASGVSGVTKVCLAYQKGKIPANLHYNEPLNHISGVRDGAVHILQEHEPFNRSYVALNSFSYSGADVHVLLKGHYKPKNVDRYKSAIPRLVLASGRHESSTKKVFDLLKKQPIDPEQIGLLHNIYQHDIPGHMFRGYSILDTNENNETICLGEKLDYQSDVARPIWFVYSGMGSQWTTMGAELMRIPIFAAAINKCHSVLQPKGIDIVRILTDADDTIYDNILHSFVGIAAVQIGLTDILKALGIVPDHIIGHSVGELGCAYADGCFTAEEMILSAYSRGLVSIQTPFIRGSMAAVGIGYKAISELCPPEIEVACRNSSESATISGPADIMKQFVSELKSKGIFAKEVPCSNIAYHSRYIASAGPGLQKYLSEVILEPKLRSEKWVSTSVPQDKWDQPTAKYSSAEYHTNNLLCPVLFEDTAKLVPANALVIEIAPHGLLQAILKRSHAECVHVPLTRRGHASPVKFLLEAIASLYKEGLNPKIENLYPKIEYPVSTETSLISHFVEWEHSEDWPEAKFNTRDKVVTSSRDFVMSIHDDDYKYLRGHVRNGVTVYPEAGLLVLVWETLAMSKFIYYRDVSVIFKDVHFHNEAHIKPEVPFRLAIMIHKGVERFEVFHNEVKIVSGLVYITRSKDILPTINDSVNKDKLVLKTEDIYKLLYFRGYNYKNDFRSIEAASIDNETANVKWNNEWVTFIDSLIQLNMLSRDHNGISTLTHIKELIIKTDIHFDATQANSSLTVQRSALHNTTRCGGAKISNIVFKDESPKIQEPDVLEIESFVPYCLTKSIDVETALLISLQIVADNVAGENINLTISKDVSIGHILKDIIMKVPLINITMDTVQDIDLEIIKKSNVIIVNKLMETEKQMKYLHDSISTNTFIITIENDATDISTRNKHFNVISKISTEENTFVLLNKVEVVDNQNVIYIPINHDSKFKWISHVSKELKSTRRAVLVWDRQPLCGVVGFVKQLNKEFENRISVLVIEDPNAPFFNPDVDFYKKQLQKRLTINILREKNWGGYYYLPTKSLDMLHNITLKCTETGDMDSFKWIDAPSPTKFSIKNKVQVHFTGPSYRDTLTASGVVQNEGDTFGLDFSGINANGERVMGLVRKGAIASTVEADEQLMWPVPKHWSLEDAATVPLPYVHAYYCLMTYVPLITTNKVFVTSGAGALGQAVISICLKLKCSVYAVVSDRKKKEFLLSLFPQLDEKNIGCSDDFFSDMVRANTNGEGCHFVVNNLSGVQRKAAMKSVAETGLFIDVNELDMRNNEDFCMGFVLDNRNYYAVDVSNLFKPEYIEQRKKIQYLVSEGLANGAVRPISRVTYTPSDISRAFRLLSSCKNIGRVLIKMKDQDHHDLKIILRKVFSATSSYIVLCDKNELGLELVDHLVTNGARNIIIHLRHKYDSGYFCAKYTQWIKKDVKIQLTTENLNRENTCELLLKAANKIGPVEGIFIIQDSPMKSSDSLKGDNFVASFESLVPAVTNLDMASRNVCKKLSDFVVMLRSSTSPIDEYPSSVCKNICRARAAVNLPALAFTMALFDEYDQQVKLESKLELQKLTTVFQALETSLRLNYNNVITYNYQKESGSKFMQKIAKILGFINLNNIPDHYTLKDLSINEVAVQEIKYALTSMLQVVYSNENIKELSIGRIKELNELSRRKPEKISNLDAFFTFIDNDECAGTEPMVAMPTKLSNATEIEEELDPKATYVMLVPGFEGHHQIFFPICERLKLPAMTFQLTPDITTESIQAISADIMKFIKKRFELKSKFYLLGYSFGVNIVLELAALMELEGYVGIVFCLDSSPDALRVQLDAYLGKLTDTQLQNAIVGHMYYLMSGNDASELKEDLKQLNSWSEKKEACVNKLRGLVNYSHQYQKCLLESAYKRIKLAQEYVPNFKLKSQIVLLKGYPHPNAEQLPDDYNLSNYTEQPVKIVQLESDHPSTPKDCRVSNIINIMLDKELLDKFEKMNLCQIYIAEALKFY